MHVGGAKNVGLGHTGCALHMNGLQPKAGIGCHVGRTQNHGLDQALTAMSRGKRYANAKHHHGGCGRNGYFRWKSHALSRTQFCSRLQPHRRAACG